MTSLILKMKITHLYRNTYLLDKFFWLFQPSKHIREEENLQCDIKIKSDKTNLIEKASTGACAGGCSTFMA